MQQCLYSEEKSQKINMKHLIEVVQNPRTLEQSFNSLTDSNVKINEREVRKFLFEYACRVSKIEKVELDKSENQGFIEFIMRNHCSNLMENIMLNSCGFDNSKTYNWSPPDVNEAISFYLSYPLSPYSYTVFQRAKEQGIFQPTAPISTSEVIA